MTNIWGICNFWKENQALTAGIEGCHPVLALCLKEGLGTAEASSGLVQAAQVTSYVLFHLLANSEMIAKNYSLLNKCQALLSCFTPTVFAPHSNPA